MSIPIIGDRSTYPQGPNNPGLTANCEIYDSEIDGIHRVLEILNQRTQHSVEYDAFDREIKDRFADLGFKVDVVWWHTDVADVKAPVITITDRIERVAFDHDRQVHEVTNDLLGLGEGGVIKTDKKTFQAPEGHSH